MTELPTPAPAVGREPDARSGAAERRLLVVPSGEIHTKGRRTRTRFQRTLRENLHAALATVPEARLVADGRRLLVTGGNLEEAASAAARVFGVKRVTEAVPLPEGDLESLAERVAERARPWVTGRTFAVRVRRRGNQPWRSGEAAARIGSLLVDDAAGVDLDHPQVEVRVEAYGDTAFLLERDWDGPGGLPLGTQEPALALLSGGFDSAVAAWLLLRRGVPVHFLHFQLECAQSDHAAAVAQDLVRRWGAGWEPLLWVCDFEEARAALLDRVDERLRQVVLKQEMFRAADALAARLDLPVLVTGEAVGQVSSQTIRHLAAIDAACGRAVLRPLAGHDKEEIVALSRRVGTHDLSARAQEVCNLAQGPVATAASEEELARAQGNLPGDLAARALERLGVIDVRTWMPGMDPVPAVAEPPPQTPVCRVEDADVHTGPVMLTGPGAIRTATRRQARGLPTYVLTDASSVPHLPPRQQARGTGASPAPASVVG